MIDITKIKLIVWDLDDTFWTGTLSEGGILPIETNIQFVRDLTDCGIINSICSKNDQEETQQQLQKIGIWDLFVFPSINWDNKGLRLQQMIEQMALRPVNVLFLDDNPSNLGEAQHFLPELQVATPDAIPNLIRQVADVPRKDINHKRLAQYKVLEQKVTEAKSYNSSEDFLYSSKIQVVMHSDCLAQKERIHELLMRSNQLNYTKKRISIEELTSIMLDSAYICGYVSVTDRFGDYGIVGFYAVRDGVAEHFLFSCRTMGQMIEQWVYAQLGFPRLEVIGAVRTHLNTTDCPGWINQPEETTDVSAMGKQTQPDELHAKILLKGPCDLSHAQVYIHNTDTFDTEFTYVRDGKEQVIDVHNHSVHIAGLKTYTEEMNRQMLADCPFVDPNMLHGRFFSGEYDVIFLSSLMESTYPIYQKRGTGLRVVLSHYSGDLGNVFQSEYEEIGYTTPAMYKTFLQQCMQWLPTKTYLCIILGVTRIYPGAERTKKAHYGINEVVKQLAHENLRIRFIDVDELVEDVSDFTDGINHYSTRLYYKIARAMIDVVQSCTGKTIASYSQRLIVVDKFIMVIRKFVKWAIPNCSPLHQWMKRVYNKIYKERK